MGNMMHRFEQIDANILTALADVETSETNKDGIACVELIKAYFRKNCSVPSYAELCAAINKFLYLGAIVINSDKIAHAKFGSEIINKAKIRTDAGPRLRELSEAVYKELAGYKLKSMCNRTVWTHAQYQQAVAAHHNSIKESEL